jgi:hypothetical protein
MADARVSVLIDLRSKLQGLEAASLGFTNLIKLATGFAATYLSVRTVVAGARDIISLGAEMEHLKARTGEAASRLLVFRQALQDAGVDAKKGEVALDNLTKRVRMAVGQNNTQARMLDQLGLDPEQLNAMGKLDRFEAVAEALRNTSDESLRTQAAMELLDGSAGELFALIDNPAAFDDAAAAIGGMGAIMDRNSVAFERADTLLGRMQNKGRQLFAGIGDILIDELLTPLEAVNRMDFSRLGQQIGGFVQVGINAFRDGRLAEFIGLVIEAGFEQGIAGAKRLWDVVFGGGAGGFWTPVLNGVMTFGVQVVETLIDAFDTPIAYLSAGFRWVTSHERYVLEVAAAAVSGAFVAVINFVAGGFEDLLNLIIRKVNQITASLPFTDGTQIGEVQIGRVNWGQWEVEAPARYGDLLAEQREGLGLLGDAVKERLNSNLDESRRILGIGTDEIGNQQTATERLNALIQKQIALREQASEPDTVGGDTSGDDSSGNGSVDPAEKTFAQTSDDRFGQFQRGIGDFGVGALDAARAGLQDFVVEMGTVAQQLYEVVGGIAGSLRESIGQSISGLINRTMTWGDALRNIGGGVVQSVIQSFSDMAAAWITKQLLMFALGQKLKAEDSASTEAKGEADAEAMAPAAATASVASFGAAAAIGLAAVLAVMAMFGAFSEGGYTGPGGKYSPAGIVHAGEDVFSQANLALWGGGREGLRNVELLRNYGPDALPLVAHRTGYGQEMVSRLRVNRQGYALGGIVGSSVSLPEIQQEVAQNRNSEPGSSQREASNVNVAILDSEQAVMRFLESSRGQRVIHSMIDNRTRRHG